MFEHDGKWSAWTTEVAGKCIMRMPFLINRNRIPDASKGYRLPFTILYKIMSSQLYGENRRRVNRAVDRSIIIEWLIIVLQKKAHTHTHRWSISCAYCRRLNFQWSPSDLYIIFILEKMMITRRGLEGQSNTAALLLAHEDKRKPKNEPDEILHASSRIGC